MHVMAQCPQCLRTYKVPRQHVGRQARCVGGHLFVVIETQDDTDLLTPGDGGSLGESEGSALRNRARCMIGAGMRALRHPNRNVILVSSIAGAAIVIVVACGLFLTSYGTPTKRLDEAVGMTRTFRPIRVSGRQVRQDLENGLKVTGGATPESRSETLGMSSQTLVVWDVNLEVANKTKLGIALGKDLLLIESDAAGAVFDGVALLRGKKKREDQGDNDGLASLLGTRDAPSYSAYGISNYEEYQDDGSSLKRRGPLFTFGGGGSGKDNSKGASMGFGTLGPRETRSLRVTLEEGSWVKEDYRNSVRVALPELSVQTTHGAERFRLVVYLDKTPAKEQQWRAARTELIGLNATDLTSLLMVPETNLVTRVFAANWLAQLDRQRAIGPLVEVGRTLRQGQLLASCLELLMGLKGRGLEDHAVGLLGEEDLPNGIRNLAARYIGRVKYERGVQALVAAAKGKDDLVAGGAIDGLGAVGGERAGEALLLLLRTPDQASRHGQVASALAMTKTPSALRALEELTLQGNKQAAEALIQGGASQSFDFFRGLARKAKDKEWGDIAARGLRACGGQQAVAPLLELLQKEAPPPTESLQQTSTVVTEMVALNAPEAVPELSRMARGGNLRALQVLAGYKHKSAQAPLRQIVRTGSQPQLGIALAGLADNWSATSVDLFRTALRAPDREIRQIAIRGLGSSKDAAAVPLLLPLLKTNKDDVSYQVVSALGQLPVGSYAPQFVEALLVTDENNVASGLVTCLIDSGWKDRSAIRRLGNKLKGSKDDMRFPMIRLLRHLSGNVMGPESYAEYNERAAEWFRRWCEWASRQ